MDLPRYGTLNQEYLASWFGRDEPGGPMWALNLMKYRPIADYADGRETTLTGEQAARVFSRPRLRPLGRRPWPTSRSQSTSPLFRSTAVNVPHGGGRHGAPKFDSSGKRLTP